MLNSTTIASIEWQVITDRIDSAGWTSANGEPFPVDYVIVDLKSTDGTSGHGVIGALKSFDPEPQSIVHQLESFAPAIRGRPARELSRLLDSNLDPQVAAGLEMGAIDLMSRSIGKSVADFVAGRHARSGSETCPTAMMVMPAVPLRTPEQMGRHGALLRAQGFKAVKTKFSGDWELDLLRLSAVRNALGPDTILVVDANGSCSEDIAFKLLPYLEAASVDVFEQPIPAGQDEGLARLRKATSIMIEGDESAGSIDDVRRLVAAGTVDCVNLRIPNLGGIAPTMAAIDLCNSAGVAWRFGVCLLPSAFQSFVFQLAAGHPAPKVPHEILEPGLLRNDPFRQLEIENGVLTFPSGPGLGVELA